MSYICTFCGIEHDGAFSPNFCSKSCACKWSNKLKYEKNPLLPRLETRTCPKCGKVFTIDLRKTNKRFCSRKCANSRSHTDEQKRKISDSVKLSYKLNPKTEFQKTTGMTKAEYFSLNDNSKARPNVNQVLRTCVICGKQFEHPKPRKTCSAECLNILRGVLNETQRGVAKVKYKTDKTWNENAYKPIYKFYYTYKITNIINGKYYLGIHMTNNLDDGYLGSGIAITAAVKKYGKENFKKEILEYFSCYKALAEAEYNLITEEVVRDINSYNLTRGGIGGPAFEGKHHTEQTKEKLRELRKLQKNIKHTQATKDKLSALKRGTKHMYNPSTQERVCVKGDAINELLQHGWQLGIKHDKT